MRYALSALVLFVVACNAYTPPPDEPDAAMGGPGTRLEADTSAHDFGNVVEGAVSTDAGVRVINRGDIPSGALSIAIADDFTVTADACTGVALAPGDGCDLAVAFAPSTAGPHATTLAVTGAADERVEIALAGMALAVGDLRADTSMHTFADTRLGVQSDELAITITNTGETMSGVMTAVLGDGAHYTVSTDDCSGAPLAPSATCTIGIRFAPVAVGGHTTSITIGATPGGQTAVSLGGSGVAEVAVTTIGSGTGTVASSPPAIDCGMTCTALVSTSAVSLTATPEPGSTFLGWTGACSGTGLCSLDVTGDTAVTARFEGPQLLTVARAGSGGGTIASDTAGIECGADCSESYAFGATVTLTATAQTGSTFAGWSGGGCSGTGSCQVTLTAETTVTAAFALEAFAVNVSRIGTGNGTVASSPIGIDCGADCLEAFPFNTVVTLTATPATGSTFSGWSGGGCTGTDTCQVTVTSIVSVTAAFTLDQHTLVVAKTGTGSGTVTSAPGISCGTDCSEVYDHGTLVTLTASAATGSTFAGWSGGGCSGTGTCQVTLTAATTVTASFSLNQYTLTVSKTGTGAGTVSSTGINCGTDCSEVYPHGTVVTLTAAPAAGATFTGWSGGGCTGTGTCQVTLTAATTVTATFTVNTYALAVTKTGPGTGTVSGTGINCGTDCSETLAHGTVVTLTATPGAGSSFGGWSGGGCSGTGSCQVTMTAATTVTASFTQTPFQLTVVRAGTGTGTVTGTGINCGTDCTEVVTSGTTITLSASAATGSTFTGWSGGGCSGTGTCQVTVTAATTVTATFTQNQYTLTVNKTGTGSGTVTATGITCGADCSEVYGHGTVVTLTAAPATGSTFTGWSGGGCSGTGTCQVTMTAATTVAASFTLTQQTLSVATAGSGLGHVTATGISCPSDCSESYPYGTMVTLTATADTGNAFTGWSGACAGTNSTCTVSMTGATSVTASFVTAYTVSVNVGAAYSIAVSPNGGTCPSGTCVYTQPSGTVVHVTLEESPDYTLKSWTGRCVGQDETCVFTITANAFTAPNLCFTDDPDYDCCMLPNLPQCDF
jgi:hypothetical protein